MDILQPSLYLDTFMVDRLLKAVPNTGINNDLQRTNFSASSSSVSTDQSTTVRTVRDTTMVTSPIDEGLGYIDTHTLSSIPTTEGSTPGYPSILPASVPSTVGSSTVPTVHAVLPRIASSLSPLQMVATSLEQLVTTNDHQAVLRHSIDMLAKDSFHRHWNPRYLSAENISHPSNNFTSANSNSSSTTPILVPFPSNLMTALGYKPEGTIISDWDVDVGTFDTRLGLAELALHETILSNNAGVKKSVIHYNTKVPEPLPTMEQLSWLMKIDPEVSVDILQLLMDMSSPDIALQDNNTLIERFRKILVRRDRQALLRKQRTEEIFATFAAVEAMIVATASFDAKACERYLSNCRAAASGGVSEDGTSNIIMMDIYSGKITFGSFPWDQPLISSSNMNTSTVINSATGNNGNGTNNTSMINPMLASNITTNASASIFELSAPVYSRSNNLTTSASSSMSHPDSKTNNPLPNLHGSRSNSPKPNKDNTAAPYPVKETTVHDLTQMVGHYEDYVLLYLPISYSVATSIMQEHNISTVHRTNNHGKDLWSSTFNDGGGNDSKLNLSDGGTLDTNHHHPSASAVSKNCGLLLEPATVPFPALRSLISDSVPVYPVPNADDESKISPSTVPPYQTSSSIVPQYFPPEHPCAGLPIPSVTREIANANIIHGVPYVHTGRRPGELVQMAPNDPSIVTENLIPSPSLPVASNPSHHGKKKDETTISNRESTDDVLLSDRIPGLRITGVMENSVVSQYGLLRTHDIVIGLGTNSSSSSSSIDQVPTLWGMNGKSKDKALPMQPSPYITTETLAEWNPSAFAKAIEKANIFIVARPRQLVLLEAVIRNLPPVVSIYTPWVLQHNNALDETFVTKHSSTSAPKVDTNYSAKVSVKVQATATDTTTIDMDPVTLRLTGAAVYETDSGIRMGSEEGSFIQAINPDGTFLPYQPTGNKHSDEELYAWDQHRGQEDVAYGNHSRHHQAHDQHNESSNARNRATGGGGGGGGIKRRRTANPITATTNTAPNTNPEDTTVISASMNDDSSAKPPTDGMEIDGERKPSTESLLPSTAIDSTLTAGPVTSTTTLTSEKRPKSKGKESGKSSTAQPTSGSYYVPLPPLLPMKRSTWNVFLGMLRSEWLRSRVQRGKGTVPANSALGMLRSNGNENTKLDADFQSDNGSVRSRTSSIDSMDANGTTLDSNNREDNEKLDDEGGLPTDTNGASGNASNVASSSLSSSGKANGANLRVHLRSFPAICMKRALWSIGIDTSGDKLAIMHRIRVMLETPIVEDDDTTMEETKPNEPERLHGHIASERLLKAMNLNQRQTLTNSRWWSIILPPIIGETEEQAMSRSLPLPFDLQIPIEESTPVNGNDLSFEPKETEGTLAVERTGRLGRIRKPSSRLLAAVADDHGSTVGTTVVPVSTTETNTPKTLRHRGKRKRSVDTAEGEQGEENKSTVTRDEDTNSQTQGPASDLRSRDDDSVIGKNSTVIESSTSDLPVVDIQEPKTKLEGDEETLASRKGSVDKEPKTTITKTKSTTSTVTATTIASTKPPLPKKTKGSTSVATSKQKGTTGTVPPASFATTLTSSTTSVPSPSPLALHTPALSLTIEEEALLEPLPDLLLNEDTLMELDHAVPSTTMIPPSHAYSGTSQKTGKNNTKTSTRSTGGSGHVSRSSGSSSALTVSTNMANMNFTENLHPVHAALNAYSNLSIDDCPHVRYTLISKRADCMEKERDLPGSGSNTVPGGTLLTTMPPTESITLSSTTTANSNNDTITAKVDVRSIDMITAVLGSVTAAQIDNSTYIISGCVPDPPSTLCRALLDLRLLHTAVTEPLTIRPLYPLALGTAQGTGLLYEYNRFQSSSTNGSGSSGTNSSTATLSLMFEGSSTMNEMIIPPDFQRTPAQFLQYIAKIISPELRRFLPQNNEGSRLLIQQAHMVRYLLGHYTSSIALNLSPVNAAVRSVTYASLASVDTPKTGSNSSGPLVVGGGAVSLSSNLASLPVNPSGSIPSLLPPVPGGRITKQTSQLAAAAAAVAASLRKGPPVPIVGASFADDTISEIEPLDYSLSTSSQLSSNVRYNRTFIQRIMYTDIGKIAHVNPLLTAYLSSSAPFAKETLTTDGPTRTPAETAIFLVNGGYRIVSAVEITRRMMNRANSYFTVPLSMVEERFRTCLPFDQRNVPSSTVNTMVSPNLLMDMSGLASGIWLGNGSSTGGSALAPSFVSSQPPLISPLRLSMHNAVSPARFLQAGKNNDHTAVPETDDITMELLSSSTHNPLGTHPSSSAASSFLDGRRSVDNTPSPNTDTHSSTALVSTLSSIPKLPSTLFSFTSSLPPLFHQPLRIGFPMDRSTQSLNRLLTLIVPLASETGPQTAASFIRHILTIHEGVIAESARRRAGALVVEAVSRGLGNLAQIICSWVPAGMTPLEGDTLLIGSTGNDTSNENTTNKYVVHSNVNGPTNTNGKTSLTSLSPSRSASAFSVRGSSSSSSSSTNDAVPLPSSMDETNTPPIHSKETLTPLRIPSSTVKEASSETTANSSVTTYKLPSRRYRTNPTVFRKRWIPLPEWSWSFPVKDTLEGSSAFTALTSDTLPFPRYTVDIRKGLPSLGTITNNGKVSSVFPVISGIVTMNHTHSTKGSIEDSSNGPIVQGTEKQALQILLGTLQTYVVEGYITTALQQRLRHPAAVLQYVVLQAQLHTLKTESHTYL